METASQDERRGDEEEKGAIELKSFTSLTSSVPAEFEATDVDQVLSLITCVRVEAGNCASDSLNTLSTLFSNLLSDPSNPKFRRLRLMNPAISKKIGQYDSCRELLEVRYRQMGGFRKVVEGNEEVMVVDNFKDDVAAL